MQKNMALLKSQKADRGLELQDIPPQLQRLFVSKDGKILLQVYGKKDLWERGPNEAFVKEVISVAPKATGTPILNYYATDLMRVAYVQAAGWAFLAIVVLIFAHFQSFKFLLLTLTQHHCHHLWRPSRVTMMTIVTIAQSPEETTHRVRSFPDLGSEAVSTRPSTRSVACSIW